MASDLYTESNYRRSFADFSTPVIYEERILITNRKNLHNTQDQLNFVPLPQYIWIKFMAFCFFVYVGSIGISFVIGCVQNGARKCAVRLLKTASDQGFVVFNIFVRQSANERGYSETTLLYF